jgi:hypothetical protein
MKYIVKFILITLAFIALVPFWVLVVSFSVYSWDRKYSDLWGNCFFEIVDLINEK